MRPIARKGLSAKTTSFLAKRTASVIASHEPKKKCETLWKSQKNKAFAEIKVSLRAMTRGRARCMYCEDNEATSIDHFWPKAAFPEKGFSWENYFFACTHCNSNFKRNQFPLNVDGQRILLNPIDDDVTEHFILSFKTGIFVELTDRAHESSKIFGLSRQSLVDGRRNAYHSLYALLAQYDRLDRQSNTDALIGTVAALAQTSFSSVLFFLRRALDEAHPESIIEPPFLELLNRHRDFLDQIA